ncbi:MAG: phenylalanine--tRNA ligase subunit beta [Betaproteobacteria bacterium]|nr:phenylalanine--tRNA ligase subunit beta [Betaproteobacteria bacterium]
MKFSENWLRTFVNPPLTSGELAQRLTLGGVEVEALEPAAPAFDGVVVGEVLALAPHPNADRLQVAQVAAGADAPLTIVCGAKNVHVGAKVPCARVGARLPAITIKEAKVRGVSSFGMLCSAQELGMAESADGLWLLGPEAPVGEDLRRYLDLDDTLFTLKVTPNRSDCLGVVGVAREVAALTGAALALPERPPVRAEEEAAMPVVVAAPHACLRYCGRVVRGIDPQAATPAWMVRRLERSGLRAVNLIVDVTNYVMLEWGQPLHAFDWAKLEGTITVRLAREAEKLMLLNGQTVSLEADMLVIADDRRVLALAGIMGGEDSAVDGATTDIFLEGAFFTPGALAGRARRLGLASDSAYRFERGVDFEGPRAALEYATRLLVSLGGAGARCGEITEWVGTLPARDPIRLRPERVRRVLGVSLDDTEMAALLAREGLAFDVRDGAFFVLPPSARFDLALEVDLIEELARLYGYDRLPSGAARGASHMRPMPESVRQTAELRGLLVARDYQEVINYSFVAPEWEADFAHQPDPVRLRNPIASHLAVMRSNLMGGLIETLRCNLNRSQERVRIFEVGRCFLRRRDGEDAGEGTFSQPIRIAGLCYGSAKAEQWGVPAREVDFYDIKGDVEALFWPHRPRFAAAPHPALHPGQSAQVFLGQELVGWVGQIHPEWQQKYALPRPAVIFELSLEALKGRALPAFAEISRMPQVRRDLAVTVDERIAVGVLLECLRDARPEIVTAVDLFDVYRGKGIDSDKKSLAFRVLMQDTHKTLTERQVDEAMASLTDLLCTRFDAKLRT